MTEADQLQMRVFRLGQQRRDLTLPAPVGLEQPVEERILRPELEVDKEWFHVRATQHFLGPPALESAAGKLPEHRYERIIEPEERIRPGPHQVPDNTIVSGDAPALGLDRILNALTKDLQRRLLPAGLPVQRIQLDEVHVEAPGKSLRQR